MFGEFVDPRTVDALLHGDPAELAPKRGRIEFILAFVRGDGPAQLSDRLGQVEKLAIAEGAVIHQIVGALVVMAFGTTPASRREPGSRSSLVRALERGLGGDVKIVHGAAQGHYGLFGTGAAVSFTFTVPHFDQVLGVLSRLAFGAVEEFRL